MNIVLVEPEIPQNTGNIARTCVLTNTALHLVKPLGFSIDDKHLKRAGLDYWNLLEVHYYDDFNQLIKRYNKEDFFYASTKGKRYYTDVNYSPNSFIVFGKETKGLSDEILHDNWDKIIKIPIKQDIKRSLNLANSVNIILFEGLKQLGFPYLE